MNISDLTATSDKAKTAEERLQARVMKGAAEQQETIQKVLSTVIVDRIWHPKKMHFIAEDSEVIAWYEEERGKRYRIHSHALGQIANVAGIPVRFVRDLSRGKYYPVDEPDSDLGWWKQETLAGLLNDFYSKEFLSKKYLRRAVGDEIRGFQGSNFKRNLATAPLLKAFVEQCGTHQAGPVEAIATDVKTVLKCMLPYVFEPVDGEFVAFGLTFCNSDFGAGRLAISATIMRVSSGTVSVLDDRFRKIHLGKVIDADDSTDLEISDATQTKELETHQSAIRDVVNSTLSVASIQKALTNIQTAHEHGIEWYKLRTSLAKALSKKQIEFVQSLLETGDDLADLPPVAKNNAGDNMATGWWAANVVGFLAGKEGNEDKKQELQQLAGALIATKAA